MSIHPILPAIKEIICSRKFVMIFGLVLSIFLIATYKNTLGQETEGFIALSTTGEFMQTDDYFNNDEHTVRLGHKISWHVNVHNGMDKTEYVSVRVKLLNSTQIIPDDRLNQPSPEPSILELNQMLAKNSTWTVPLEWSIEKVNVQSEYVTIKELTINGEDVSNLNIMSVNGNNFKIVLELWRYDNDANDFVFLWSSGHDIRSVWNQIWFNVKI